MKAFLLAAGLGTRLRPLTDTMPKCMLPVRGQPVLGIWLDALARADVSEVVVNLHHLPDVVLDYLEDRTAPPAVRPVYEPELLGSAGTLAANRRLVEKDGFFLACNADSLTDFNIGKLISAHAEHAPLATLTAFRSRAPSAGGVLEISSDDMMTGFTEKPENPVSDLVNAGIYAFSPAVLDEISSEFPKDIGYDLLPRLTGKSRVIRIDGYFRDIGTPWDYRRAQQEWNEI